MIFLNIDYERERLLSSIELPDSKNLSEGKFLFLAAKVICLETRTNYFNISFALNIYILYLIKCYLSLVLGFLTTQKLFNMYGNNILTDSCCEQLSWSIDWRHLLLVHCVLQSYRCKCFGLFPLARTVLVMSLFSYRFFPLISQTYKE